MKTTVSEFKRLQIGILICSSLLAILVQAGRVHVKQYEDCDKWAREGECVNNPGFMWTSCHASCMFGPTAAADIDAECPEWAQQGECENNPNYIQLHCPVSCGQAIGWSPFIRQKAGIERVLPFSNEAAADVCADGVPRSLFGAAETIRHRLITYLDGGASSVKGLSHSSPSDYLGVMGLAEAVLYAARLYEAASPATANGVKDLVEQVHYVLNQGYGSDLLVRTMPSWLPALETISKSTYRTLTSSAKVPNVIDGATACNFVTGAEMTNIAALATQNSNTRNTRGSAAAPKPVADAEDGHLYFLLNNGEKMPAIGLGTWQLNGAVCEQAVGDAIELGYRHIDSAQAYANEGDIGWAIHNAIAKGLTTRDKLFLATKLSNEQQGGYIQTKALVNQQLALLKTDYIDLYMLHSPFRNFEHQFQTWRALEELVGEGKIRSLGVSNFDGRELRRLVEKAVIKPTVVQNKLDPYHVGKQLDNRGDDLVEYARSQGIIVVAYSSFSSYPFVMEPMDDPIINWIAAKHTLTSGEGVVTPAQVIIKWALNKGFANIPRSTRPTHLQANLEASAVELSAEDMAMIDALQYLVESPVSKAVPV